MKFAPVLFFFLFLFVASSCTKECCDNVETPRETLGRWHLVETFVGTGTGGGEFKSVISDHTLDFISDTTLVTTGSLCPPFSENLTTATYSIVDSIILPNCVDPMNPISFTIKDSVLILGFQARCGFMYKYEKMDN